MPDTALTIISDALLDLGVLADGQIPSASQAQGGLRKLNNMIDAWNIENLMVYGAQSYVIPFVAGKQVYTLGPGGDFDMDRPSRISSAFTRDTTLTQQSTFDNPLTIFTDAEWQELTLKYQQQAWPNIGVWFNWTYPLVQAYVNPIPNSSQYSFVVWTDGALSNLALDQAISFAPGYKRALTANLAIELAASYGGDVSATIATIARDSVQNLKVQNFQLNRMQVAGSQQYWNYTNRVYVR